MRKTTFAIIGFWVLALVLTIGTIAYLYGEKRPYNRTDWKSSRTTIERKFGDIRHVCLNLTPSEGYVDEIPTGDIRITVDPSLTENVLSIPEEGDAYIGSEQKEDTLYISLKMPGTENEDRGIRVNANTGLWQLKLKAPLSSIQKIPGKSEQSYYNKMERILVTYDCPVATDKLTISKPKQSWGISLIVGDIDTLYNKSDCSGAIKVISYADTRIGVIYTDYMFPMNECRADEVYLNRSHVDDLLLPSNDCTIHWQKTIPNE